MTKPPAASEGDAPGVGRPPVAAVAKRARPAIRAVALLALGDEYLRCHAAPLSPEQLLPAAFGTIVLALFSHLVVTVAWAIFGDKPLAGR